MTPIDISSDIYMDQGAFEHASQEWMQDNKATMQADMQLIFLGIWHLIVYCPLAHFEWGGGFMSKWGVLDFAGGDVVHISSGVSGLAASLIVGKRNSAMETASQVLYLFLLLLLTHD